MASANTMQHGLHQRPHSTPKEHRGRRSKPVKGQWSSANADIDKADSLSFDETGDSTRSLLSVLSHSSVQEIPESMLAEETHEEKNDPASLSSKDSVSRSSRPDTRSEDSKSASSSSSSSRSESKTETHTTSSSHTRPTTDRTTSTTSHTSTSRTPPLSPWEKWLVGKAKVDRQKLNAKAKLEKEKQAKAAEEKKMKAERAKLIEAKVSLWVEERTAKDVASRRADQRIERTKKQLQLEEKRRVQQKAKENYKEWSEKKREEKKAAERLKKEEQRAKLEMEERRKEDAEAAYQKWRQEANKRPLPLSSPFGYPKGTSKGYHDKASYPIPSFCNPIPWLPIHTPSDHAQPEGGKGKGRRGKGCALSTAHRQIQQPLSPPLLFQEREARKRCGKPR